MKNRVRLPRYDPRVRASRVAIALAVLLFGLASVFGELLLSDLSRTAPMPVLAHKELTLAKAPDQRFSAWLTARNAHTLRTQPSRLFEAEACFPARNSLAYGEPMITLGIVGIPSSLVSGDPLVVFNTVLIAIVVISAFAMYLLIVEWTGEPAAALAAALVSHAHSRSNSAAS